MYHTYILHAYYLNITYTFRVQLNHNYHIYCSTVVDRYIDKSASERFLPFFESFCHFFYDRQTVVIDRSSLATTLSTVKQENIICTSSQTCVNQVQQYSNTVPTSYTDKYHKMPIKALTKFLPLLSATININEYIDETAKNYDSYHHGHYSRNVLRESCIKLLWVEVYRSIRLGHGASVDKTLPSIITS